MERLKTIARKEGGKRVGGKFFSVTWYTLRGRKGEGSFLPPVDGGGKGKEGKKKNAGEWRFF